MLKAPESSLSDSAATANWTVGLDSAKVIGLVPLMVALVGAPSVMVTVRLGPPKPPSLKMPLMVAAVWPAGRTSGLGVTPLTPAVPPSVNGSVVTAPEGPDSATGTLKPAPFWVGMPKDAAGGA